MQRQKDPEERGSAVTTDSRARQDCIEDGADSNFEHSASEEDMPTGQLGPGVRDCELQLPNCDSESECSSMDSGDGLNHDDDAFDACESRLRARQQGLEFQPDVLRVNFDQPLQVSPTSSMSPPPMEAHAGRQETWRPRL